MTTNINGDFSQWALGNTFAAAASGQMLADGWRLHKAGAAVHTIRESSDVPDWRNCGRVLPCSLEIEVTTPDASLGASDVTALVYRGEGLEIADLFNGRIRVRGYVKGPVGIYGIHIGNGAETLSYAQAIEIRNADVWNYFDVYAPWYGTEADWWTDYRVGYTLAFVLMAGSSFQGDLDEWASHSASAWRLSGASQINFNATNGNIFRIAGVRVGEGAMLPEPDDLTEMACMRYVEKSFDRDVAPAQNLGANTGELRFPTQVAGATSQESPNVRFIIPKRVAPSMTGYSPQAASNQPYNAGAGAACTALAFTNIKTNGFKFTCTGPAGGAVAQAIGLHWVAEANLPAMGSSIGS